MFILELVRAINYSRDRAVIFYIKVSDGNRFRGSDNINLIK